MSLPDNYQGGALDAIKDSLTFERENVAEWRKFRQKTGRWPIASVGFHYSLLFTFLSSLLVFLYLLATRDWGWRDLLAGVAWLSLLAILWVGGRDFVSKMENKRSSRR